ncbi:MAG: flavin reductase family protein [Sandaracinaceae bacterium]|nr:flavin reductase family protein [Sandaracinaceae bacterium]
MRVPVELKKSWRLFNHGPVTLVSAAADGAANVMAAAWVTPLDFDPPKLTVVLAADAYTRELAVRAGTLVLQVPTVSMLSIVEGVGTTSGRDVDKWSRFAIEREDEPSAPAPLVRGCVGWMVARLLDEPHLAEAYDLFVVEGIAAWADDRVYRDGRLRDDVPPELRTVHHVAGGVYVVDGEIVKAR